MMNTSLDGQDLIKFSETVDGRPQLVSYPCSAGKYTIAFGRTRGIVKGMTCTPVEAQRMLREDIAEHEEIVRHLISVPITQGMFDGLSSFAFNYGAEKCASYNLFKWINEGRPREEIEAKWMEYIYDVGDDDGDGDTDAMIERGHVIRRIREILMSRGYSWRVVEAAATANNIHTEEEKRAWANGGVKEYLLNGPELLEESIGRAKSMSAFFNEPTQPDETPQPIKEEPVMAETEDFVEPEFWDKLPENQQTEYLNMWQEMKARTSKTMTISTKKKVIETPNLKPDATPGAMEDSLTANGMAKKKAGQESAVIGTGALGVTGTISLVQQLTGVAQEATDTATETTTFLFGLTLQQIMIITVILGGAAAVIGGYRWIVGSGMMDEGRKRAEAPKV